MSVKYLDTDTSEILDSQDLLPLLRMDAKDAIKQIAELGGEGLRIVRHLVKLYYQHQKFRIHSDNVIRKIEASEFEKIVQRYQDNPAIVERLNAQFKQYGKKGFFRDAGKLLLNELLGSGIDDFLNALNGMPTKLLEWSSRRDLKTEDAIYGLMDYYTNVESSGMGSWAKQHVGIGPVISAGFVSMIDKRERTVSQLWRFAGVDPTMPRKWTTVHDDHLRPFNANLKLVLWKAGHSFMMQHGRPNCFYGKIYVQRKHYEQERNDRGDNAQLAAQALQERTWDQSTNAYAALIAGKLPPGQIEQRSQRYAAKMFLCHWLVEAWRHWFGEDMLTSARPPLWILHNSNPTMQQHTHYIPAPTYNDNGDLNNDLALC